MNDDHHASQRPFPADEDLDRLPADEVLQAQLTAYALGQLEGVEKARIEAELATSPTARREVVEIQSWADRLRSANRAMVIPPSPSLREAIARHLQQAPSLLAVSLGQVPDRIEVKRPTRRRDWRSWAAVAAAACLLAAATSLFWGRGQRMTEQLAGGGLAPPVPGPVADRDLASFPKSTSETLSGPMASSVAELTPQPARSVPEAQAAPATPASASDSASSASAEVAATSSQNAPQNPPPRTVAEPSKEPPRSESQIATDAELPQSKAASAPRSPIKAESLHPPPSVLGQAASRGTRHVAAAKPRFLEVYMSTPPPDLTALPPTAKPKERRDAGALSAQPGERAAATSREDTSASEIRAMPNGTLAKSLPSQSHLALPPGMRPARDVESHDGQPRPDRTKARTKHKEPQAEATSPDNPPPETLVPVENDFLPTAKFPYSAFSLAVDRGAFAHVRRCLLNNQLPRPDQVQIEELINDFAYDDPLPNPGNWFAIRVESADCPWAGEHRLVRIAISSQPVLEPDNTPPARPLDRSLPIANDVRVQVQFNPQVAAAYRLIGYDSPPLRNDLADVDLIGGASFLPGQTVVALYEVVPVSQTSRGQTPRVEARPGRAQRGSDRDLVVFDPATTLLTVRLRFQPRGEKPRWLEVPGIDRGQSFEAASPDFRFSAAVAAFGQILRCSPHRGNITWDDVERIAEAARGSDPQRAEFLELIRLARQMGADRQK